jgi:hypothetical protein
MLGAGTVINPIIKIVTTVAVLAAIYFFIMKPILDTTNTAFESFSDSFDGFDNLPADIQSQIDDAFETTGDSGRLEACIERAINGTDVNRQAIQRCVDRFAG